MQGPFNLGRMSMPVAYAATAWVIFITIAFCLPAVNPVDSQTLNYTPVAVGIVAVGTLSTWFLWARKWFVGPRKGELKSQCFLFSWRFFSLSLGSGGKTSRGRRRRAR